MDFSVSLTEGEYGVIDEPETWLAQPIILRVDPYHHCTAEEKSCRGPTRTCKIHHRKSSLQFKKCPEHSKDECCQITVIGIMFAG